MNSVQRESNKNRSASKKAASTCGPTHSQASITAVYERLDGSLGAAAGLSSFSSMSERDKQERGRKQRNKQIEREKRESEGNQRHMEGKILTMVKWRDFGGMLLLTKNAGLFSRYLR